MSSTHSPSLLTQFIHSAISMCFYPLQSLVRTAIGALEIPESGLFWLQALESWIIFQIDTETAFTCGRKRDIISIFHYTTRAPANSSETEFKLHKIRIFIWFCKKANLIKWPVAFSSFSISDSTPPTINNNAITGDKILSCKLLT